jgi:hypothetical protein
VRKSVQVPAEMPTEVPIPVAFGRFTVATEYTAAQADEAAFRHQCQKAIVASVDPAGHLPLHADVVGILAGSTSPGRVCHPVLIFI